MGPVAEFCHFCEENPQRGSFGLSSAYWEIFQLDHPLWKSCVHFQCKKEKPLTEKKVDFAVEKLSFSFFCQPSKEYLWKKLRWYLNVKLLRGWYWAVVQVPCMGIGQVVEFFCWNLEYSSLYSPLKRPLFVDGDIFNVPNWCDIICQLQNLLFCNIFWLSH